MNKKTYLVSVTAALLAGLGLGQIEMNKAEARTEERPHGASFRVDPEDQTQLEDIIQRGGCPIINERLKLSGANACNASTMVYRSCFVWTDETDEEGSTTRVVDADPRFMMTELVIGAPQ